MTVQEMIDELNKVEDKSRELSLYAASNSPCISGTLEVFGCVDSVGIDLLEDDNDINDVVIYSWVDYIQLASGSKCSDCTKKDSCEVEKHE